MNLYPLSSAGQRVMVAIGIFGNKPFICAEDEEVVAEMIVLVGKCGFSYEDGGHSNTGLPVCRQNGSKKLQ